MRQILSYLSTGLVIFVCVSIILSTSNSSLIAAPPPKDTTKKDSPILGVWEIPPSPHDRRTVTFTFLAEGVMVVDGGIGQGQAENGSYSVNDRADPPEIDYLMPAQANRKGPPYLGIYKIEKDTLTIYYSKHERPTKLESCRDAGIVEMVLQRQKK